MTIRGNSYYGQMISSSQLANFFSLAAPGFIAIEAFRSAYPVKTRKDKSSPYPYAVYSLAAEVILRLAYRLPPTFFLGHGIPSKSSAFYPFVILGVGWLVEQACILYYGIRFWLSKRVGVLRALRPDPQTTLNRLNSDLGDRWAIVFLGQLRIYGSYQVLEF
jgi:hypothetical protein